MKELRVDMERWEDKVEGWGEVSVGVGEGVILEGIYRVWVVVVWDEEVLDLEIVRDNGVKGFVMR